MQRDKVCEALDVLLSHGRLHCLPCLWRGKEQREKVAIPLCSAASSAVGAVAARPCEVGDGREDLRGQMSQQLDVRTGGPFFLCVGG